MSPTDFVEQVKIEAVQEPGDHKHKVRWSYKAEVNVRTKKDPILCQTRACPTAYEAFVEILKLLHAS